MSAELFEILDLTLELRSSDGTATEFRQQDPDRIAEILRLLATPRFFSEPQLTIASECRVNTFTPGAIDMILVRTTAPLPQILPLNSPAGPIHIYEANPFPPGTHPISDSHITNRDNSNGEMHTFRVDICTLGGWTNALDVRAQVRGTVQDRRQTFAHIFQVPVIPFYVGTGGIGFINPRNLTRATAYPLPDSLPESALSMEYVRQSSSQPGNRTIFA